VARRTSSSEKGLGARYLLPYFEVPLAHLPVIRCAKQMPAVAEKIVHSRVKREEALSVASRLKAPHVSLPLTGGLVGELASIVRISASVMIRSGQDFPCGRGVALGPIGHETHRLGTLGFQCHAEEPLGGPCIASTLHEDIDDVSILVDRAPEVVDLSVDRDEDLVDMPDVTEPAFPALETLTKPRPNLQAPTAHGLVGDDDATLGEQILDVVEAQTESVIRPDRVADDLRRKSVSVVSGFALVHWVSVPNARPM